MDSKHERPEEQQAVNTTIVGGRPPGCGKPVGEIPRGIEVLVKKAAVDPAFRTLLLEQRSAAADEIGLTLAPAEAVMLDAVTQPQLDGIIANTVVPPKQRPAFMGRAAAAMLIALGATVMSGCDGLAPTKGIAPDRPEPPEQTQPVEPAEPASKGIRPDRPKSEPQPKPQPPELPTLGVRPDRPEPRPSEPVSRGVRPDRPNRTAPTDDATADEN